MKKRYNNIFGFVGNNRQNIKVKDGINRWMVVANEGQMMIRLITLISLWQWH